MRAFNISELSRARSLSEMLNNTQTSYAQNLDPELAEKEKSLRQSLRFKEDYKITLLGGKYRREELVALESEIAQLEKEYKEVVETIKARYPAREEFVHPVAWELRQIQEQVVADDQTVLLEYSLGKENSYV